MGGIYNAGIRMSQGLGILRGLIEGLGKVRPSSQMRDVLTGLRKSRERYSFSCGAVDHARKLGKAGKVQIPWHPPEDSRNFPSPNQMT